MERGGSRLFGVFEHRKNTKTKGTLNMLKLILFLWKKWRNRSRRTSQKITQVNIITIINKG